MPVVTKILSAMCKFFGKRDKEFARDKNLEISSEIHQQGGSMSIDKYIVLHDLRMQLILTKSLNTLIGWMFICYMAMVLIMFAFLIIYLRFYARP
jgi:hypothetical protein